jgi:hypothetical protein
MTAGKLLPLRHRGRKLPAPIHGVLMLARKLLLLLVAIVAVAPRAPAAVAGCTCERKPRVASGCCDSPEPKGGKPAPRGGCCEMVPLERGPHDAIETGKPPAPASAAPAFHPATPDALTPDLRCRALPPRGADPPGDPQSLLLSLCTFRI